MSSNAELWARRSAAVARGVGSASQLFADRALNAEIWDVEGKRYIDFAGGIGVLNTGHRHPKVVAAIEAQLARVIHSCFQVMPYEPYIELAEKLNELAPIAGLAKTLLLSTGAEAVENAVKIARAATGRPGIIAFSGGFHGRTMMGMALTGKVVPYKLGFGPFPADIHHARFPHPYHGVSVEDALGDIAHLFKSDIEATRVAAFIIEPVQGEGGFTVAPPEFMRALRELADQHGILLIADEVQSGFARTGKFFAMEHYDVQADLITTAKSIGGGLPLSGVVGRAAVMDAPAPGGLGGTYAGNPIACAAACAVIDVIREENILARAARLGANFRAYMEQLATQTANGIGEIRGLGAMMAFEIVKPGTREPDADRTRAITARAAELGLMLLSCGVYYNTIRVLVPITVSDAVFDEGLDLLARAIRDTAA
ncbi:MAG: 4-aminobutyrate--2-oxoglutarate transaminase [Gammaproteobacteria bacterium]|jgi:4-aminobutyrate aminotransferase|nr:4-aminobutyrate--2-oxoglutarate transaminase [Gammaproteobacteria bacterium]MBP6050256.1 4-aminobutyrate--2-oxoglutarate transaminase [Pseudomonadales bacterium]MBK6583824.1 4-aminobutyrate--2-oxoglutarate transaminase [Gammaproteobacteria bacterium]MBK7169726.1 4-aminobutyrate--2-oxoglutarate transaminase [Gammaproteobacteria bacterium]MBK7522161.1 4-aminobutyrate--2-oxoglutarate transaminase [Gammaproteobacteria bacterium]